MVLTFVKPKKHQPPCQLPKKHTPDHKPRAKMADFLNKHGTSGRFSVSVVCCLVNVASVGFGRIRNYFRRASHFYQT